MRQWAIVLAMAFLASVNSVQAGTITINPNKDNTLIQVVPGDPQLSNGQGDIYVSRTNQDGPGPTTPTKSIRRGLVAFDIAGSIPAGATITSVKLTMRDVMGLNGDPIVTLHRALADWGEGNSFTSGGAGVPAQQNDATWLY